MTVASEVIARTRDLVRDEFGLLPVTARSKPGLSGAAGDRITTVDLSALRGITHYDPAELTLTALAGTPILDIRRELGEHGQQLPFDPPLAEAGATLGGTVAAGVSGPGAWGHGTVRDFVIGVSLIDGTGTLVKGGGRVVKNAAGFDLPKLMVGSIGTLGVLTEISLKVFPRPAATLTLRFTLDGFESSLTAIAAIGRGPIRTVALDLVPPASLLARLGGPARTLPALAGRLEGIVGAAAERLDDDARLWRDASELAWAPHGDAIVRIALSPGRATGLQRSLASKGARVRYSNGVNVAWVAWPAKRTLVELDRELERLGLTAITVIGPPGRRLLGQRRGGAFAERIRAALDPDSRFLEA
jgi:glycolate oxidase FAD binding subunit